MDTGFAARDDHIRSAEFLDVTNHPVMTYRSATVAQDGDEYVVKGELTLRGISRPVDLTVEPLGFGPDDHGGMRCGFSATAKVNRKRDRTRCGSGPPTEGASPVSLRETTGPEAPPPPPAHAGGGC